jgi:SAM-dependent MidA family methyltransferase
MIEIEGEKHLSQQVHTYLANAYHQKGAPLSFSEWMSGALYAPNLGYYHNAKSKFGPQGDFMTAPNFSPLFGQCLAEQLQAILCELPVTNILEIGPGNGTLAKTIMETLTELGQPVNTYYLLETSPSLKSCQNQLLAPISNQTKIPCQWVTEVPENFIGVILANEVIDALPAERFCFADTNHYQGIILQNDAWHWEKTSVPIHHQEAFATLIKNNPQCLSHTPYISEYRPNLAGWFNPLCQRFKQGVMLFIDYGYHEAEYYHPERRQGTLRCFYHHQQHDNPLWMPGIQDISVHVDFSAFASLATKANLDLLGYCTQANFLINLHILDKFDPQVDSQEILQKLLHPVEMGEVVKVMALGRNWSQPLQGFQGRQSML